MNRFRALASLLVAVPLCAAAACSTGASDADLASGELLDASTSDVATVPPGEDAGPKPSGPRCGNGKIETGEACDDGNQVSDDGCSATCTVESAGPDDLCEGGAAITLENVAGTTRWTARVLGSTTALYDHYAHGCGGGTGADAVYRLDPPKTGRAVVKMKAAFEGIVAVRSACNDTTSEMACQAQIAAPDGGASGAEVALPVFDGQPVWIFVDGYGGTKGAFALDVEVQTALCGNGKAEYPETCDDGNTVDGDGCSAACAQEDTSTVSACPGMGYRLGAGAVSFAGDTSTMSNGGGSATGCAYTGSGQNAVYAITPKVSGNLALSLTANYPEALLHVRRTCAENATQADCVGSAAPLVPLTASVAVNAEETIYVFVDSNGTTKNGLFTLDATLTAGACANGRLDPGEECDDGNTAVGDGCSDTCLVERDPSTYTCPGKAVRLDANAPTKVVGTTAPLAGQTVPASKFSSCGVTGAPDVVYQVTSPIPGMLTAKVKGPFNTAVSVRASCPGTADLACAKAAGGNGQETVSTPIEAETPVFVVVDGAVAGQSGAFELELAVRASACGNFVQEGGETCDDGALDDGDGCSATCQLETEKARDLCTTAPAVTMAVGPSGRYEATVTSGTTNLTKPAGLTHALSPCLSTGADAWFAVTAPEAGVLTARVTSATFRSAIAIRSTCVASSQLACDSGTGKGGQEIVVGVQKDQVVFLGVAGAALTGAPLVGRFTVALDLAPAGCGDTFVTGGEACDDGNTASGDGCSSTCQLEDLGGIAACGGHPVTLAGSGGDVRRAVVTVDTAKLSSVTGGACGGSGPEGILRITPDVDGQLDVKATAGFATSLYMRTTCNDPGTEAPRGSCSGLSSYSAAVTKNTPYYLYVDGMNGAAGVAKVQITVTP